MCLTLFYDCFLLITKLRTLFLIGNYNFRLYYLFDSNRAFINW